MAEEVIGILICNVIINIPTMVSVMSQITLNKTTKLEETTCNAQRGKKKMILVSE